jgi:hypothetical protein
MKQALRSSLRLLHSVKIGPSAHQSNGLFHTGSKQNEGKVGHARSINVKVNSACRGRDNSVGIATGYWLMVRGSNPGGGRDFRTRPDRPWGPPSILYNGYWVFPGVKQPGRDAYHPPLSSVKVKKE